MITITCNHCKRELTEDELITIGSENNSLKFKKPSTGQGVYHLERYSDLHFCGKVCFLEFFFGKETPCKPL